MIAQASHPRRAALLALAALLLGGSAGCAPAGTTPAGAPITVLYVANGRDGTVTRVDGATGRVLAPPRPAGIGPGQAVAGEGGHLLVLPIALGHSGVLTYVAPAGGAWATRPITVEHDATRDIIAEAFLAGDGGRYAVVAYGLIPRAPPPEGSDEPSRCRLALVDLRQGSITRTLRPCEAQELVVGLSLDEGPPGPVAYLAVSQPPTATEPARGRIVALDARTGAVLATLALDGAPGPVALGPAPRRPGRRLYVVEAFPQRISDDESLPATGRGRLLGLNPATLALESEQPVARAPHWLVVAPDGEAAYVLSSGWWERVTRLDLLTGAATPFSFVPNYGLGAGLAVTEERVYVSDPWGHQLWAFDRRRGAHLQTIPIGRGPLEITAGPYR
jgi:DNA-binding beta-propeller fold protein YncE